MGKIVGYSLFLEIPINYDGLCVFKLIVIESEGEI
ncbi:hypothetical protein SAMN05877753_104407 [Bacillus oleivorans]|uniref:Uncharacterized protein n=1 Tax=Bacillus oleivorans TaxID=1448271 RepID=A0A285CV05_9BACI|nr:hypothetical protein SAMN05877753_104407 [Bacillus oleivorans]